MLALVVPAAAYGYNTTPCYGGDYNGNEGAWVGKDPNTNTNGLKAKVDFYTGSAPAGRSIAHPMQMLFENSNDWVGFGTYKGSGASCIHDTTNWSIYMDGRTFGQYFCTSNSSWPDYSYQDNGILFKLAPKSNCLPGIKGVGGWTNSTHRVCGIFVGQNDAWRISLGGEYATTQSSPPNVDIDIRYRQIKKRASATGTWAWGNSNLGNCWNYNYGFKEYAVDDWLVRNDA